MSSRRYDGPHYRARLFALALRPASPLAGYTGLIERAGTSADIIFGLALLVPLWAGKRLARSA